MITDVYIIRKDMNKFFMLDSDTGNWQWSSNLEDATVYPTPDKAEIIKFQKQLDSDSYIYQIPYSVAQPQQRKKKSTKKTVTKRTKVKKLKRK